MLDEKSKPAFEFAKESVKQLIALATGIIALSISFGKDLLAGVSPVAASLAMWSWGVFLLSVLFGIWALLALAGTVDPEKSDGKAPLSIYRGNIRVPAMLQVLSFVAGLVLIVVFGVVAIRNGA